MPFNPERHHRRSIRLKNYDYSQVGCYFITLCVQNRYNLFGKIVNGKMQLNQYGMIAQEEWERTPIIRKNVSLGEFIIMPNHFHAVVHIDYQIKSEDDRTGIFKSPTHTIGAIIRGYKGATTKRIKELIRNNKEETEGGSKGGSKGELQFAPTAPTAPTAPKIDLSKSIWQRDYWEHIIRNENAYRRISQYIINNPKKWENDKLNGGRAK